MNSSDKSLFDLEAIYTLKFISLLLEITREKALEYVDWQGQLTPKGKLALDHLNKLHQDNNIHSH